MSMSIILFTIIIVPCIYSWCVDFSLVYVLFTCLVIEFFFIAILPKTQLFKWPNIQIKTRSSKWSSPICPSSSTPLKSPIHVKKNPRPAQPSRYTNQPPTCMHFGSHIPHQPQPLAFAASPSLVYFIEAGSHLIQTLLKEEIFLPLCSLEPPLCQPTWPCPEQALHYTAII